MKYFAEISSRGGSSMFLEVEANDIGEAFRILRAFCLGLKTGPAMIGTPAGPFNIEGLSKSKTRGVTYEKLEV